MYVTGFGSSRATRRSILYIHSLYSCYAVSCDVTSLSPVFPIELPYAHCSLVIYYHSSCFIPSTYESLPYAHCSFVIYYHSPSFRTSCEQRRLCRCVNPQRPFLSYAISCTREPCAGWRALAGLRASSSALLGGGVRRPRAAARYACTRARRRPTRWYIATYAAARCVLDPRLGLHARLVHATRTGTPRRRSRSRGARGPRGLPMGLFTMGLRARFCEGRLWRSSLGVAQGFALGFSAVLIAPGGAQLVPQAESGAADETTLLEPTVVGKFVRGICCPAVCCTSICS
eukprot:COSAG02_NODE_284_length_25691_cov_14.733354_7_plen_287_part_00